MLGLEHRVLGHADALAVEQQLGVAQGLALLGEVAQGEDATIDVHRRVLGGGAAVGGGDLVIGVAVRLEHLHDLAQQRGALPVSECSQGGTALFACEGKTFGQVQPGAAHAHQRRAQHRVEQRAAVAGAVLPAAGEEIGKQGGGVHVGSG
ncbi:hypothetical protein D9M70_599860 [compost metagenome]